MIGRHVDVGVHFVDGWGVDFTGWNFMLQKVSNDLVVGFFGSHHRTKQAMVVTVPPPPSLTLLPHGVFDPSLNIMSQ